MQFLEIVNFNTWNTYFFFLFLVNWFLLMKFYKSNKTAQLQQKLTQKPKHNTKEEGKLQGTCQRIKMSKWTRVVPTTSAGQESNSRELIVTGKSILTTKLCLLTGEIRISKGTKISLTKKKKRNRNLVRSLLFFFFCLAQCL